MNIIDGIRIEGFWGNKTVDLKFHPDINFLIGVNGSGKTTVINLLAAALNADFATIDRAPFDRLTINLVGLDSDKTGTVVIEKVPSDDLPFPKITYSIHDHTNDKVLNFSLDAMEEQLILRDRNFAARHFPEIRRRQGRGIQEQLAALIGTSWLSIHRSRLGRESKEDGSFESTVDKKLDDMANSLVRYFSTLEKKGTELLDDFQRRIFMSLLVSRDVDSTLSEVSKLDVDGERNALIEILRSFKIGEYAYRQPIEKHFAALKIAQEKFGSKTPSLDLREFSTLLETLRIHEVVNDWRVLTDRQSEIFAPRETFLQILNELFQRKTMKINPQNEVVAGTSSGKELALKDLSSGEKQILIILGEALLQERRNHVYIADEPELSLHVSWQETLIENIRRVNPNAQLVVATHSPDIVGRNNKKVFRMEDIIQ